MRTDPARPAAERSVGLLAETLDLLARAQRGLSAFDGASREYRVPSKSRPGEVNVVTVTNGVARCSCAGFGYRGNCSHVRRVVERLARGGRR